MFRNLLSKLLNIDTFSTNKKINRFFAHLSKDEWVFKDTFLSILELLIRNNFNTEKSGRLQENERTRLLRIITKLKKREAISKIDNININDKMSVLRLGHFISVMRQLGKPQKHSKFRIPKYLNLETLYIFGTLYKI